MGWRTMGQEDLAASCASGGSGRSGRLQVDFGVMGSEAKTNGQMGAGIMDSDSAMELLADQQTLNT